MKVSIIGTNGGITWSVYSNRKIIGTFPYYRLAEEWATEQGFCVD